ncbi:NAD(P)H-dependent oxidoreductase (plasmid) [Azospirillum baldaniorum]|uniref:NADPH-dependent FMN reductase n=1 Tax=Azospirillum baldaniorum TaxID=1064539 RepID=A0A9P1JYD7_9PROT|nr:NAD(P)H-dependent oxidoreductase [Azospirillum baldaniorum]AWJ93958.1 NAD(P)H-dependent oxidoreductase [Azospirillum baldaniorum]TWA65638.1 chromate reductase [Azospirillum baldaniorum]TWA81787.1 chromate reductase [Azospirillum brasilense]CCD02138.1 NADPH-dependent FMN reductase [Azospirillum baldaniorum]
MTDTAKPVRLLGLSGSIRRHSHCTAVLNTLAGSLGNKAGNKAEMALFPLNDIPPYDPDLDAENTPAPATALRDAIAAADGLVIISPEYNYGMSGVLKNALDWASRPAMKSPVRGKPILIMTASPAFTGGVRAQHEMRETLSGMMGRVIARPQVVIGMVHEKIKDGRLTDQAALDFALAAIDDLLSEIALLRGAKGA